MTSYDPATTALLAAMRVQPPSSLIDQINTLIVSLKGAGIWNQLDALWVPCLHDQQAATLNWLNPSQYALTATGSGGFYSPLFVPYRGFSGSGQGWLTTGYTPSVTGVNYTLNSASLWAWQNLPINPVSSSSRNIIMGSTTAPRAYINLANSSLGGEVVVSVNDGGFFASAASPFYNGLFGAQRISANQVKASFNGTQLGGVGSVTSTALASQELYLLAQHGGASAYFELGFAAVGASLSGLESVLHGAVSSYMSATMTTQGWKDNVSAFVQGINSNYSNGNINAGAILAYEYTQPWTVLCAARLLYKPVLGRAGILFTNATTAQAWPGYELWFDQNGNLHSRLINNILGPRYIGVHDSTDWSDKAWHIFGATYDGSGIAAGVKLYVDGVQQIATVESDTLNSGSIVGIGQIFQMLNQKGEAFGLLGQMAHFQLSDLVRPPAFISGFSGPGSQPKVDGNHVLYYNFAEGNGTTTIDLSSGGHVATLTTSSFWRT
jgi:hypothetical protein